MSDIPAGISSTTAEYADDLAFVFGADSENACADLAQQGMSRFQTYLDGKGLQISLDKTKAMLFTSRKSPIYPVLTMSNRPIEFVSHFRYLGMILDGPSLTWKNHIQVIAGEARKRSNLLKAFSARSWGADKKMLTNIYKALILSKINYGGEFLGVASKESLKTLDVIQNNCLRLIL